MLVIEDGCRAIRNAHAVDDARRGELDILGEQMPFPPADLVDNLRGDKEARTRNRAARVEIQARLGEELRLTEEPRRITCGNPVGIVILGITIARRGHRAIVEGLVHLAEIIHVENIVGIEDEVRLVATVGVLRENRLDAEIERIAFADELVVEAAEDDRARLLGNLSGIVSTIVSHHEDVDQLGRIVLHLNRVDEVADYRALVAGRDEHGITMVLFRRELTRLRDKNVENVEQLVRVANGEYEKHAEIEDVDERYLREKLVYHVFLLLMRRCRDYRRSGGVGPSPCAALTHPRSHLQLPHLCESQHQFALLSKPSEL